MTHTTAPELSEKERSALLTLLADEDPEVYQTIRKKILSFGPKAQPWLKSQALHDEPAVRKRVREILYHLESRAADTRFLAFCLNQGEELDIEEGVLQLSQTRYPDFNPEGYRALLDCYAEELRPQVSMLHKAEQIIDILNDYLFEKLRYHGDETHYYDDQNSYLNRVMDRRKGNPISLCLIYILLAKRLGLPIVGIGMPSHFLCRYQTAKGDIYIDAFHHGKIMTKADCVRFLMKSNFGFREEFVYPASARRMLLRVCSNLHQIYYSQKKSERIDQFQRYIIALS